MPMNNNNRQYVIELDGVIYSLKGNRLKQIKDLNGSKGEFCFITEMQETISRTMTVEAPVKYAEFVVRKRLQESGDFDEPVKSLISDGSVKSTEIKACESRGMRSTYVYSAVTRDEA